MVYLGYLYDTAYSRISTSSENEGASMMCCPICSTLCSGWQQWNAEDWWIAFIRSAVQTVKYDAVYGHCHCHCDGTVPCSKTVLPWWRHQMKTFSASLALCKRNSRHKGQWRRGLRLYKRLSKQSWRWWFETPSRSLWRYCNGLLVSKSTSHLIWPEVLHCHLAEPTTLPMMTPSNRNFFRVTGPLCGEFTGRRWIPRTKSSHAELWCFLSSAHE